MGIPEVECAAVERLFLGKHDVPLCMFTCGDYGLKLANALLTIWEEALLLAGVTGFNRVRIWRAACLCPADLAAMRRIATEGGLDSMLEAYWSGVPVEDVVA